MPITLIRVVNEQTINRSLLLDKLDDGQANTEGYANLPKQQVYVPYSNPLDASVKGYVDFIPTSRVLLSSNNGTISGMAAAGKISTFAFSSALSVTPVVTSVSNLGTDTTIDGTTLLSVTPDVTYVKFTNLAGVSQMVPSSAFSGFVATQIVVPDAAVTIGTPGEGWTVQVKANSKLSNVMPIGNVAVITTAIFDAPTAGDVTITGIDFLSTAPLTSSVVFTGTGAVTLTQAAITGGGGVFTNVSIVIPSALVPGIAEGTTSVAVVAEGFTSAAKALIVTPVLATVILNSPTAGDVTFTGTSFLSNTGDSTVAFTGTGAVTLTQTAILAAGGVAAFTNNSIVVPAALVPGIAEGTTSASVTADSLTSLSRAVIVTPVLTIAQLNTPTLGDMTITGTSLLSNAGDSSVAFSSPLNLTQTDITGAGGTFNDTTIVIPAALLAGAVSESDSLVVTADGLASNTIFVLAVPVIDSALIDQPGAGDLTIAGTGFVSVQPENTSVDITGTGAITLTHAVITGGAGSVTDTSIVIPAALFTNGAIAATTSSARVTADFIDSNVVAVA